MKYESYVDVTFTPEDLKPYAGPDISQKFPGEDDRIWCERCQVHHRRGAPWEVERERAIQKAAKKIADRIDNDARFLLTPPSQ